MSLDGADESPDLWQCDSFGDELGQLLGATMASVDTAVFGRVGFLECSGSWPTAGDDDPFAAFINPLPRFVASTTTRQELLRPTVTSKGDAVLTYALRAA